MSLHDRLIIIYSMMYKVYGPRRWWPAKSPFEVAVGAILTQNTNWSNVEKAIGNLKDKNVLDPRSLHALKQSRLGSLIRPCGYYNIKARRLKSFIAYLSRRHSGRISSLRRIPVKKLREELLSINGIGPETADSIILYALEKPVFVVDAYTKRIMSCLGIVNADSGYDEVQAVFMRNLPEDTRLFNEYHALIVEHAKTVCRAKPSCRECILRKLKV